MRVFRPAFFCVCVGQLEFSLFFPAPRTSPSAASPPMSGTVTVDPGYSAFLLTQFLRVITYAPLLQLLGWELLERPMPMPSPFVSGPLSTSERPERPTRNSVPSMLPVVAPEPPVTESTETAPNPDTDLLVPSSASTVVSVSGSAVSSDEKGTTGESHTVTGPCVCVQVHLVALLVWLKFCVVCHTCRGIVDVAHR